MFAAHNMMLAGAKKASATYKGSAVSLSNTLTLPSHNIGDLIVIFGGVNGSAPTKPSAGGTVPTWTTIDTINGYWAGILVYTIATANNHTSGFWFNASRLSVAVFSGQAASPIGKYALTNASTSGSTTTNKGAYAAALASPKTDGSSVFLQMWGSEDPVYTTGNYGVPSGYTLRSPQDSSSESLNNSVTTKNDTTSDGAVTFANPAGGTGSSYVSAQLEILAP